MEGNNGTFILQTKGPEYRVSTFSGVENVYGDWDDTTQKWKPNETFVKEVFQKSEVYHTLEEAWDSAGSVNNPFLISDFDGWKFPDEEDKA